ncbi:hypothetical protein BDW74DRAFT_180337 [Aspergillus multicolor]|uniref:uncharacterized protein n=1 Tax=Aspergillus multicolor TaxID=41759 RepID=UPI003CCCB938
MTRPQPTFWRRSGSRAPPTPSTPLPFAGRLGANQEFTLDKQPRDAEETSLLQKFPDAAPWIPLGQSLDLSHITQIELWKAAVIEGVGSCFLVYLTCFVAVGLGGWTFASGPLVPSLLGASTALISLPLFIFATGPVSGAHLNPTITLATFFGRLATLPRCILYISFQTLGASLAGLLLRASFDSRDFTVPGCTFNTSQITLRSAFTIEFTTDFALLFLSFGVGLDPRQRDVFGPALGPILVGFVLAMCTFFTGISRPGYSGFSGNPARCFGAMVGSHFAVYHWIHWVGPLAASIAHGVLYYVFPPYSQKVVGGDDEAGA